MYNHIALLFLLSSPIKSFKTFYFQYMTDYLSREADALMRAHTHLYDKEGGSVPFFLHLVRL